ncbi:MAG: hypothetical protein R3C20_09810 [Planctomycetaceae bacterium]
MNRIIMLAVVTLFQALSQSPTKMRRATGRRMYPMPAMAKSRVLCAPGLRATRQVTARTRRQENLAAARRGNVSLPASLVSASQANVRPLNAAANVSQTTPATLTLAELASAKQSPLSKACSDDSVACPFSAGDQAATTTFNDSGPEMRILQRRLSGKSHQLCRSKGSHGNIRSRIQHSGKPGSGLVTALALVEA